MNIKYIDAKTQVHPVPNDPKLVQLLTIDSKIKAKLKKLKIGKYGSVSFLKNDQYQTFTLYVFDKKYLDNLGLKIDEQ